MGYGASGPWTSEVLSSECPWPSDVHQQTQSWTRMPIYVARGLLSPVSWQPEISKYLYSPRLASASSVGSLGTFRISEVSPPLLLDTQIYTFFFFSLRIGRYEKGSMETLTNISRTVETVLYVCKGPVTVLSQYP